MWYGVHWCVCLLKRRFYFTMWYCEFVSKCEIATPTETSASGAATAASHMKHMWICISFLNDDDNWLTERYWLMIGICVSVLSVCVCVYVMKRYIFVELILSERHWSVLLLPFSLHCNGAKPFFSHYYFDLFRFFLVHLFRISIRLGAGLLKRFIHTQRDMCSSFRLTRVVHLFVSVDWIRPIGISINFSYCNHNGVFVL